MTLVPELWREYAKFTELRARAFATGQIDMHEVGWVYPSTLLPLTGFILKSKDKNLRYLPPKDENVASYVRLMIENPGGGTRPFKSYIPNNFLPRKRPEADRVVRRVLDLQNNGEGVGGQSAFAYLVGELVDNIYEHSVFENAMVMAQRYDKKRFLDISFFDDGVTIPGSLRQAGFYYDADLGAIQDAINGRSSKEGFERGYGLGTNVRMCTDRNGLRGKVLVVSGSGAVGYSLEQSGQHLYNLHGTSYILDGTLISIRIPYMSEEVNIYDFAD